MTMSISRRIGLQIDEFDSGYSRILIAGISSVCREKGVDLVIFSGRSAGWPFGYEYQNTSIFGHITSRNIDALIIASGTQCNYISHEKYISYVQSLHPIPVVSLAFEIPGVPSLLVDNDSGFRMLLMHLVHKHGCRRIAVVKGPDENPDSARRMEVYRSVLSENDLEYDSSIILSGNFSISSGYEVLKNYPLIDKPDFDAIVALNDMMATGCLRYCAEKGIRVPEDVIVTGFDNISRSRYIHPTLTTVSQDLYYQGKYSAECAMRLVSGESLPMLTILPTKMLLRQSCGCVGLNDTQTNALDVNGQAIPGVDDVEQMPELDRYRLEDDVAHLRQYLGHLHAFQTIPELVKKLRTELESFQIKSCMVGLYSERISNKIYDTFSFPDQVKLILSYDENSPEMDYTRGVFFDPREKMFPEGLFSARSRILVATTLYHREDQLGYILYEPGNINASIYETLCVQLSNNISAAMEFTEKHVLEVQLQEALQRLEANNVVLNDISRTDELTGLLNRRGLLARGQQNIDISLRKNNNGLVVFADMDGLKTINDTWGHDAGDRAIKAMADVLKKTFRSGDIISRFAGDEFVIISVDAGNHFAGTLRPRLNGLLKAWNSMGTEPFRLSVSIGAVEYSPEASNLEKLLAMADMVLYDEKRRKKDTL